MMETEENKKKEKPGVVKFLFPVPTIVIMAIYALFLLTAKTKDTNESLTAWQYLIMLIGIYIFICLPLDLIIYLVRSAKKKRAAKSQKSAAQKQQNAPAPHNPYKPAPTQVPQYNPYMSQQPFIQPQEPYNPQPTYNLPVQPQPQPQPQPQQIIPQTPEQVGKAENDISERLEKQGDKMAELQEQIAVMIEEIKKAKEPTPTPVITPLTPTKPTEKPKIFVDFYFYQAAKLAVEKDKLTPGMVMREFKVGRRRADQIVNQLVAHCIIIADPKRNDFYTPLLTRGGLEDFEASYRMIASNDYDTVTSQSRIDLYNNQYDYMEGHDFEAYCAELLQKNGFDGVEVTPGSNDQGIDIIAYQHGIKFGIQCKRYSSDVGNKAVQEAFAGSTYYHCNVAAVLTNQHFTTQAKDLAKRTGVLLWDRDYLDAMITECKGNELSTE